MGQLPLKSDLSRAQRGRSANVWNALTMRVIEFLPPEQEKACIAESQDTSHMDISAGADRIISRVTSILWSLVDVSQITALQGDLDKVANAAIDVWDNAQKSGELNITVNQLLERQHREEWRAPQFDLAAPSRG